MARPTLPHPHHDDVVADLGECTFHPSPPELVADATFDHASSRTPKAYSAVPTPARTRTMVKIRNAAVGSPTSRKPTVVTVVTDWYSGVEEAEPEQQVADRADDEHGERGARAPGRLGTTGRRLPPDAIANFSWRSPRGSRCR